MVEHMLSDFEKRCNQYEQSPLLRAFQALLCLTDRHDYVKTGESDERTTYTCAYCKAWRRENDSGASVRGKAPHVLHPHPDYKQP